MNKNKKQIIYSLKVVQELMELGFEPERVMPNPLKPEFKCWVFSVDDAFQTAVNDVLGKRGHHNG